MSLGLVGADGTSGVGENVVFLANVLAGEIVYISDGNGMEADDLCFLGEFGSVIGCDCRSSVTSKLLARFLCIRLVI